MIRSIPPDVRSPIEQKYKVKRYMPNYKRMRTATLEKLLTDAQDLERQLLEVVKADPNDANLERLDKIQIVITQLKMQIFTRKRG